MINLRPDWTMNQIRRVFAAHAGTGIGCVRPSKSILLIVVIITLSLVYLGTAIASPENSIPKHDCAFIQCDDETGNASDSDPEPIRISGGLIISISDPSVNRNVARRFFPLMRKFPTLASCVTNDNPLDTLLAKAEINWSKMGANAEVEICLFRLFDAMGDVDEIATWLARAGFSKIDVSKDYSSLNRYIESKGGTWIAAFRPATEGSLVGGSFDRLLFWLFSRGIFIDVAVKSDGRVFSVDFQSRPVSEK